MNRVLLGMSGGTDSSMSAILLQEAGYEVVGITFRFWDSPEAPRHLEDARTLSDRLGIEHYVLDAREEFNRSIVDYFTGEYMRGRTPVPCVKCNNELKWKLLLQEANRLEIPHIATGHYTRKGWYKETLCVMKGIDEEKDQSFFLWGLGNEILSRALFPLGEMTKQSVRSYAAQKGFERVATKKDSIGVCFCPGDYHSFLRQHIHPSLFVEGDFIDESGEMIGRHMGYPFYTVGQRRGLGVQRRYPLFVKSIDVENNRIMLAPLSDMYQDSFTISHIRSINRDFLTDSEPLICRIRYRKQATPCFLEFTSEDQAIVRLLEPLESIAPGQSAVFYRDEKVMGGGIID